MPRLSKIGAAALAAFGWTGLNTVSASYLQVAGGGGAGSFGGGGAGGFLTGTTSLIPTQSYTVLVGAGGAGVISGPSGGGINGSNGSNSQFGTLTASVGGGAGGGYAAPVAGSAGGSGGGGGYSDPIGSALGGAGTSGQGNAGGSGSIGGAGGGGASAAGSNGGGSGSAGVGGAGGNGTASSISGASVTYAGGGGGGNGDARTGGSGGAGGTGGGGAGGTGVLSTGAAGTANLGGGGGGGGSGSGTNYGGGGQGGSGVVIISYPSPQKFGGGVVTSSGGNTIHTFTTSGTLSPLSSLTASYLIVAGGGGGGTGGLNVYNGGAGGAGGLLTGSGLVIDTNSIYAVTVGAGGATNVVGSNSAFNAYTSIGGGQGATGSGGATGGSGGSGGGGASHTGGGSNFGTGTSGQGNNGGSGSSSGAGGVYGSGGGGGASAVGSNGTSSVGGNGGAGTASSISGTSVTYAGGGGGAASSGSAGTGGAGGGGSGGVAAAGSAGTANLGGGGGAGSGLGASYAGGAGGSGVVIISYPGSTQQMAGGTVTVAGGNVIHTFTSSGYLAPIYSANNSLRFRSSASAYLNRTPTTASNRRTWTYSAWVKRGALSYGEATLFNAGTTGIGSNDTGFLGIRFTSGDTLDITTGLTDLRNTTQVFRDPAAWYHIVVAVDTTQATAANRVNVYVNGTQVTAFGTSNNPSLNLDTAVNNTNVHEIARTSWNAAGYYDGYMAEVNFIDGQALTPNSFGTFNGLGVWQPIRYGGSYGTNGFYLPFNVDKTQFSYAFNTTPSYLTSSTAGIMPLGNTTWSIECWVWFNAVPSSNVAFIANTATGGVQIFYRPAVNTVEIGAYAQADVLPATTTINNSIANAWNHFAFTSNGTQLRIFFNGILIGYLSSSYAFAASQSTVYIGTNDTTSAQTLNGFISNLRVCNGSIPTTYQTSSTTINASIFTPPTTALTTTSQGAANVSLLTCQSSTIVDNSSSPKTLAMTGTVTPSNIGFSSNPFYDQSPQGNNWTPNNISLVNGSTLDSMTDVPTLTSATAANYAVMNPLIQTSNLNLSNANLTINGTGSYSTSPATFGMSSGKWYWEYTCTTYSASGDTHYGIGTGAFNIYQNTWAGSTSAGWIYAASNGNKYNNNSATAYGSSFTSGDVIGVAFDADNGTLTFYKNNTSQGTAFTGLTSGPYFPVATVGTSNVTNANFGQRPFVYTPPTGFVALNTFNLTTPTIGATAATTANKYFDATTFDGVTGGGTVTNSGSMQPDFVWMKVRNNANNHELADSVRGTPYASFSNLTNAEVSDTRVSAFNSNGFSYGTNSNSAITGRTVVGWQWRASNATAVTNTAGSITSTVSANTTSGFSIVTYTGTGSVATIGHGLGVKPSMIFFKVRSNGTYGWYVYNSVIGATNHLVLDTTAASSSSSFLFNDTEPTTTVMSVGTSPGTNQSGQTFVAYCFAPIAGYSAFGSYTGNGSSDGTFVFTGFRPRFLIVKRTSDIGSWIMTDSARSTYNVTGELFNANTSGAEFTTSDIKFDYLSNGFKLREVNGAINASGSSYIYMAFAESPFKYANAR